MCAELPVLAVAAIAKEHAKRDGAESNPLRLVAVGAYRVAGLLYNHLDFAGQSLLQLAVAFVRELVRHALVMIFSTFRYMYLPATTQVLTLECFCPKVPFPAPPCTGSPRCLFTGTVSAFWKEVCSRHVHLPPLPEHAAREGARAAARPASDRGAGEHTAQQPLDCVLATTTRAAPCASF